jgi:hypothetical protein
MSEAAGKQETPISKSNLDIEKNKVLLAAKMSKEEIPVIADAIGLNSNVVDWYRDEQSMLWSIGKGGAVDMKGVDVTWLEIYYNVHPDEAKCPEAHKAFRAFRSHYIGSYNITHDDKISPEDFEKLDKFFALKAKTEKGETK